MTNTLGSKLSASFLSPLDRQLERRFIGTTGLRSVLFLGCLLGALFAALLNTVFAPLIFRDDMSGSTYHSDGIFNPPNNAYGFSESLVANDGTTYSWADAHSTITFPYAANLGRYAHASLRVSSSYSATYPPPEVILSLNGKSVLTFRPGESYQVYNATIDTRRVPNPNLDPSNVQVDLQVSTLAPLQDGSQVGIAVDWIKLKPQRAVDEIIAEIIIWVVGVLAVLLAAHRRFSLFWVLLFGLLALVSFALIHLLYQPRAINATTEIALAALAWVMGALLVPRDRPIWGLGFVVFALWVVLAGHWLGDWRMDDSYISYRYAWNFVHGDGLVYNPGAIVEGYTNFLWTILASAGIAMGLHPPTLMLAATLVLSLCLLGLTYYLSLKLSNNTQPWPILALVLLSFDICFDTYGVRGSGIEAVPFSCFVLAAIAALWSIGDKSFVVARVLAGLALAAASLTRPEGLMVAGLFLGIRVWQDRVAGKPTLKLLLAALVPYLAIVVPYQIWRITFYGYLFPNTFYAKTGNPLAFISRGLNYSQLFWLEHWLLALFLLLGLVLGLRFLLTFLGNRHTRPATNPLSLALILLVTIYACYIVFVGGDDFPGYRFFVPLIAPLVLLAVVSVQKTVELLSSTYQVRMMTRAAITVAVIGYVAGSLRVQGPDQELGFHTYAHTVLTEKWAAAGLWLRDNTPPQTSIAALGAGSIAYYSQRTTIDILGLNDLHIAHVQIPNMGAGRAGHEKSDPAYVLGRAPDYMLAYAESLSQFADFQVELDRDYEKQFLRSPIGLEIPWVHRKDESDR